ncbi:hypothetical protein BDQ17DRAFT_735229 [Cyathus striatus]|nr:hypothetical protein BDQ17DRAFT_735229 [Cyathus striatus]
MTRILFAHLRLSNYLESRRRYSLRCHTSFCRCCKVSVDTLRSPITQESSQQSAESLRINCDLPPPPPEENARTSGTPAVGDKFSSVRSILRDPHTPGTGQNVRFFSRDAYKVISPDQSMEQDFLSLPQQPSRQDQQRTFLERLSQSSLEDGSHPVTPGTTSSRSPRPTAAEVFSPLSSPAEISQDSNKSIVDMSLTAGSMPPPEVTNLFNMSQQLELPTFPPPGLGFNVDAPVLDSSVELNHSLVETTGAEPGAYSTQMTSTPLKPRDLNKGKGKQKAADNKENENIEAPASTLVDDTIFHKNEKAPQLPSPIHDRSHSFSFGQTVFYSMNNSSSKGSSNYSPAYPSSDLKGESPARSTPSKSRSRALSDTVFQSMLRAAKPPEADINDDSSQDLVVYSDPHPEPDPFSANATTYYTPQTMIPTTPPQAVRHTRKTSKEESLIVSLQTQLALQTELCQQYEADLRSRDEVVELLNKRVADLEKVENQRRLLSGTGRRKFKNSSVCAANSKKKLTHPDRKAWSAV